MALPEYSPESLSQALHLTASDMIEDYPILSSIFDMHEGHNAVNISVTVIEGATDLMAVLDIFDPPSVGGRTGKRTLSITLPKFWESRSIGLTGELLSLREPDNVSERATMMLESEVNREHSDLIGKFLSTLDYMCALSLTGKISMPNAQNAVVVVANWNLPASHTPPPFTGAAAPGGQDDTWETNNVLPKPWTADDSRPDNDIEFAKTLIRRETRRSPRQWIGVGGSDAVNALRSNKTLRGSQLRLSRQQLLDELELDNIIEYNMEAYSYDTQTWSRPIKKNQFVVLGKSPRFFVLHYLRIHDVLRQIRMLAMGQANVEWPQSDIPMGDIEAMIAASELTFTPRPRALDVTLESYPLPMCQAPGCAVVMQPVE